MRSIKRTEKKNDLNSCVNYNHQRFSLTWVHVIIIMLNLVLKILYQHSEDKRDNSRPTQTKSLALLSLGYVSIVSYPIFFSPVQNTIDFSEIPDSSLPANTHPYVEMSKLIAVSLYSGKRPSMVHLVVNSLIMSCRASWPGEKALGW